MMKFDPMRTRVPLLKRLVPSLRKRWAGLFWPGGFTVVRVRGARFLVNYRNFVDRQLAFYGGYEDAQLDYLLGAMTAARCDLFLDVGANFGLYSVLVAKVGAARRIVAIEPDPRSNAQHEANLLLNDLIGRVEILALAATDQSRAVPFVAGPATTTGQSRIAPSAGAASVAGTRLDELIEVQGQTIFAKIDVEGHEREAVAGMAALFQGNRVFLQVESFDPSAVALTADLTRFGLVRVHGIGDDHYFANFTP